jgi:hypothetical protein
VRRLRHQQSAGKAEDEKAPELDRMSLPRMRRLTLDVATRIVGWTGQSLKQGGRVVGHRSEAFIGIDTSKLRSNAVAIAEGSRGGEVRYVGEFLRRRQ